MIYLNEKIRILKSCVSSLSAVVLLLEAISDSDGFITSNEYFLKKDVMFFFVNYEFFHCYQKVNKIFATKAQLRFTAISNKARTMRLAF